MKSLFLALLLILSLGMSLNSKSSEWQELIDFDIGFIGQVCSNFSAYFSEDCVVNGEDTILSIIHFVQILANLKNFNFNEFLLWATYDLHTILSEYWDCIGANDIYIKLKIFIEQIMKNPSKYWKAVLQAIFNEYINLPNDVTTIQSDIAKAHYYYAGQDVANIILRIFHVNF